MNEKTVQGLSRRFKLVAAIGGSAVIALLVVVIVLLFQVTSSDKIDAEKEGEAISSGIIDKVSKLYILPVNEEPTVALLESKDRLENNKEFFKDATEGDYVLVYKNAKLALIYREEVNKLVNVGPVAFEE